ncbi:MAG: response regulator [Mangrovibacterium sp.]|nr:response regulator [Mangrovibacterium sp.]
MTGNTDFSNLNVLIADDNPVNRRVVTLLLKGRLQHVDVAGTGSEALSKFMQKHYDIILMDIHMPEMNGYEAASAIRLYEAGNYRNKKAIIIAMTASEEGEVISRCYDAGMDAYLGKPFLVQQLFDILKRFVGA